jgi:L-threonylcarbamoyladenylate synthase
MIKTQVFAVNSGYYNKSIHRAVELLKRGALIVFPTETVYGLAADSRNKKAIRRIRGIKKRSLGKSLSLQVGSLKDAASLVKRTSAFDCLAERYWPGPLTIVSCLKNGKGKIGIRIPDHKFALKLLKLYKKPLVVTSANKSGQKDITGKKDLLDFFESKVEMIFYEPKRIKKASTVVDITGKKPLILRPGPITEKEILRVTGFNE